MASLYVDGYRPWPAWVVRGNEEIARKFGAQIGTYRGHADRDPGHDMSGNLATDFWLYDNTKAKHDAVLAWFKTNARRIGATYIITRDRIWSVERAAEGVRDYGGDDPHNDHIHISYGTNPPEGDEEDMPTAKEIAAELAQNTAFLKAVGKAAWAADVITPPQGHRTTDNPKWTAGGTLEFIAQAADTVRDEMPPAPPA